MIGSITNIWFAMFKKIAFTFMIIFGITGLASANNLKVSAFDAVTTDAVSQAMTLTFDLYQENSWRNNTSHDAVWLFMKYSTDGGATWHHATMNNSGVTPAGYVVPAGFEVVVPQDGKGFFFRRNTLTSGTINASGVRFVWNFSADGLTADVAASPNTLVHLFGIEMVYIPSGAFFAGDGAGALEARFEASPSNAQPWYISSDNAITTTNASTTGYYYQSSGAPGENASGDVFLITNSFPKGYKAFYLMKYELTEGEWVSFFNMLSVAARRNRDITSVVQGGKGSSASVNRNTISWDVTNPLLPARTQRPSRAMTYISWPDAAAFASWAALRPLTELEFEKAARGVDVQPAVNEFAWGAATYNTAGADAISPSNLDENGAETVANGSANVNANALGWTSGDGRNGGISAGQKGALRAGIFAVGSSNRRVSGAGYYGNMELSGNVAEPAVTVGRAEGRQFLGSHGTGEVSLAAGYEGNALNVDWPGIDRQDAARGVTGTAGIGYRGGDYQSANVDYLQISSRMFAAKDPDSMGFAQRYDARAGVVYGARFARTSP